MKHMRGAGVSGSHPAALPHPYHRVRFGTNSVEHGSSSTPLTPKTDFGACSDLCPDILHDLAIPEYRNRFLRYKVLRVMQELYHPT